MHITPILIRWSRASNRRRALELAVLGAPWMIAGIAAALAAGELAGPTAAGVVGGGAALGLAVAGVRRRRRIWRDPMSTALAVDRAGGTSDLLASAAAIEAGARPDAPLAPVVLERARAIVPSLEAGAVPPLRLRIDPGGTLSAIAAVAVVFLLGATAHRAGDHAAAEAERAREATAAAALDETELKKLLETVDRIARDRSAPAEAREQAAKAAEAIARAKVAPSAAGALGELSEAARALDKAARAMAERKPPAANELAKLEADKLAKQLAEAAKKADSAALAALAREALRRAAADPAAAQQMAEALAKAAAMAKAGAADPDAERRLAKLAEAAAQMGGGNTDAAKNQLAALDRMMKTSPPSPDQLAQQQLQQQLDAARQQLGAMRGAQRDALNREADARMQAAAQAARQAMGSGMRPGAMGDQDARAAAARAQGQMGSGMGSQAGSGAMPGQARMPGNGRMPGPGQLTPGGQQPGGQQPGGMQAGNQQGAPTTQNAPPGPSRDGPDSVVSVRTGSGHGGHGPTGPTKPSGAGSPSSFTAEQVDTAPAMTPEGAVRAIAEKMSGLHQPTAFDRARDQYQAIAEAAIRKDDIPLTRRDYIQRYFEALRTREDQPQ